MRCPNCSAENTTSVGKCSQCGHALPFLPETEARAAEYIKDSKIYALVTVAFIGLSILLQFLKPSDDIQVVNLSANVAASVVGIWAALRYFSAVNLLGEKAPYFGQLMLGLIAGAICVAFVFPTFGLSLVALFFMNKHVRDQYKWRGFTLGCLVVPVIFLLLIGACFLSIG